MAIEAILFDLGDTLLDFGKVDIDALFSEGARLAYHYLQRLGTADKLPSFGAYRRSNILSIKLHYLWSHIVRRELDCKALLDKLARKMGIRLTDGQVDELAWLWYKPLAESARLEPGIHTCLEKLKAMSLKLGIISNTFIPAAAHDRHLCQLDLLGFFPVRRYSSATIFRKPDRRIFRAALQQLDVTPAATIMVGDKWGPDIRGAIRSGITPVFKRTALNRSRRVPRHVPVVETIGELPALIHRLRTDGAKERS